MAHATRCTVNPIARFVRVLAQATRELFYFGLLAVAAYLMLALASYTPHDSAWSHAGMATVRPHNAGGTLGAWTADTLYHFLGASAYLLPTGLLVLILASLRDRMRLLDILLQFLGIALLTMGHSLWVTLYPSYLTQPLDAPVNGILGLLLVQQVELYLGQPNIVICVALSLILGASLLLRVSLPGWVAALLSAVASRVTSLVRQVSSRVPKTAAKADPPLPTGRHRMKYTLNPLTWVLWVLDSLGELVLALGRFGYQLIAVRNSVTRSIHPQQMADILTPEPASPGQGSLESPIPAPRQAYKLSEPELNARAVGLPVVTPLIPEPPPASSQPGLKLEPWILPEPSVQALPTFLSPEPDEDALPALSATLPDAAQDLDALPVYLSQPPRVETPPSEPVPEAVTIDEWLDIPSTPETCVVPATQAISQATSPMPVPPEPVGVPEPLLPTLPPVTVTSAELAEKKFESTQSLSLSSRLPGIQLLDPAAPQVATAAYTPAQLEELSRQVEARLADFGVKVNVMGTEPGPVITRFELLLAPGTKASKITGLARDLARSLSVTSIRVVEVIPGKAFVGLELPNKHRESVRLSEILQAREYLENPLPTLLALGKDVSGRPSLINLTKLPHLLVAGTTGSGKSVAVNAMIISLLYKATADQVRMIMIDPKMLELSIYDGIPHLLTPVVTDMRKAANALRWCVGEMERRYHLMATQKVRDIVGYNAKINAALAAGQPIPDPTIPRESLHLFAERPTLGSFPYIVVIIDELADMMMMVGKKVEELIARLAQKARACGIHLILATQRPSVDVLTGLIKANVPARISFQVSSKIDSRTILDQMGAESLLGQGDMLYLGPGSSGVPTRYHGAFVADHEVHQVVEFLKLQGTPDYIDEILDDEEEETPKGGDNADTGDGEKDPLYDEAVKIVLAERKASTSWVQRRLRIGYNRAARIVEAMEAAGLVGKPQQNGVREVIIERHEI